MNEEGLDFDEELTLSDKIKEARRIFCLLYLYSQNTQKTIKNGTSTTIQRQLIHLINVQVHIHQINTHPKLGFGIECSKCNI